MMKRLFAILLILCLSFSTLGIAAEAEYTDKETVFAVQQALNEQGYDCGKPDGSAGKKTAAAISKFQEDNGMEQTGTITKEVLYSLGVLSVYEEEFMFQNVPWGTSHEGVVAQLRSSGFADPNMTLSEGGGCIIWPDDDDVSKEESFYEPDDFASEGGFQSGVVPIKTIAGHLPENVFLSYFYDVRDSVINHKISHLVAVEAVFDTSGTEEGIPIYSDILESLENKYGTFEKYINKEESDNDEYSELKNKFSNFKEKNIENFVTYKLYCLKFGQNETAICLSMDQWGWVRLIYSKTDSEQKLNEIMEIIEALKIFLDDAGV